MFLVLMDGSLVAQCNLLLQHTCKYNHAVWRTNYSTIILTPLLLSSMGEGVGVADRVDVADSAGVTNGKENGEKNNIALCLHVETSTEHDYFNHDPFFFLLH